MLTHFFNTYVNFSVFVYKFSAALLLLRTWRDTYFALKHSTIDLDA